jgi:hypothetical protein
MRLDALLAVKQRHYRAPTSSTLAEGTKPASLLMLTGNQTCGAEMKGGARVLRRSPRNA